MLTHWSYIFLAPTHRIIYIYKITDESCLHQGIMKIIDAVWLHQRTIKIPDVSWLYWGTIMRPLACFDSITERCWRSLMHYDLPHHGIKISDALWLHQRTIIKIPDALWITREQWSMIHYGFTKEEWDHWHFMTSSGKMMKIPDALWLYQGTMISDALQNNDKDPWCLNQGTIISDALQLHQGTMIKIPDAL